MNASSSILPQVLFFAVLVFGLYVLAVRPQRARAREAAAVRASLAPGSRVLTTAGMHATVREVEGDEVVLEIAPGVLVRFAAGAVLRVLEPRDGTSEPGSAV